MVLKEWLRHNEDEWALPPNNWIPPKRWCSILFCSQISHMPPVAFGNQERIVAMECKVVKNYQGLSLCPNASHSIAKRKICKQRVCAAFMLEDQDPGVNPRVVQKEQIFKKWN